MDGILAAGAQQFRPQILERRERLRAAATSLSSEYLNDLLSEVDAALRRIDGGGFGLCETCHETIERDRLEANPLVRFCLDHLSPGELEAHQQDLDLAARIQFKLLPPSDLMMAPWETHYRYLPAGPVGGDYCEVTVLADGKTLFFAVGDVAGKGVAASLLMTHLSAILRSLLSLELSLAEIMARANRLFCENTLAAHYATLVCGIARAGGVELSNAGHCPPWIVRRGSLERLESAGLPLGLFCSAEYPVSHLRLEEGESLVLYTDGVTEAQDPSGNHFGEQGLTGSLLRHFDGGAAVLGLGVVNDVAAFRGGGSPTDDLTLLIVRSTS